MSNTPVPIETARSVINVQAKRYQAVLAPDKSNGLSSAVTFSRWMSAVVADFEKSDKLRLAAVQAPETVHDCLSVAANYGLLPGSAYSQFYLIPRWDGRTKRTTCTFIVGYKGMMELALRHPDVLAVEANLVYEGEPFAWNPGSNTLHHEWRLGVDREPKNIVACYSRVTLKSGYSSYWVMDRAQIDAIRKRAQSADNGPWVTDYAAMARKTCIRAHFSGGSIPKSAQLQQVLEADVEHPLSQGRAVDIQAANAQAPALGATPEESASLRAADGLRQAAGMAPKVQVDDGVIHPSDMFAEEAVEYVRAAKDKKAALAEVDLSRFGPNDRQMVEDAAR